MTAPERFDLAPDLSALIGLAEWAEGFCDRHAVPAKANFALQLCLEEAVSNAIRHGALAPSDRILVDLRITGGRLIVDITDPGQPFDPLQAPRPEAATGLEDAVIGGQGIELMRKFCQTMHYSRCDATNRLQVVIALER